MDNYPRRWVRKKKKKKEDCIYSPVGACVLFIFGTDAPIFICHFQAILIKIRWAPWASQLDIHSFLLQLKKQQLIFSRVCHNGFHEASCLCHKIVNLTANSIFSYIPHLGGDCCMYLMWTKMKQDLKPTPASCLSHAVSAVQSFCCLALKQGVLETKMSMALTSVWEPWVHGCMH